MKLEPLDDGRLHELRGLWLTLHTHHQSVAPELAPYTSAELSWTRRLAQYKAVFGAGGFGWVVRDGRRPSGYLICAKRPMQWQATFPLPPMLWELVTLVLDPDTRGRGVGADLLREMEAHVSRSDTNTKLIGVLPQNARAIEFYLAHGYVPAWLTLTRFRRAASLDPSSRQIAIVPFRSTDVSPLRQLWLSLHHHHQAVSPHLHPFLDDDKSWPVIEELFAKSASDGLLFVATDGDRFAGLAAGAIYPADDMSAYADTWEIGDTVAETKFLVVDGDSRGQGIGGALMDAMERELAKRGATDHLIGAIAPNAGAIAFYQSRGFRPAWLELIKI